MELDAMATELWLLLSCEWTEAVEEGGEYQAELLLKSSYYYSQSVFLSILCKLFFSFDHFCFCRAFTSFAEHFKAEEV